MPVNYRKDYFTVVLFSSVKFYIYFKDREPFKIFHLFIFSIESLCLAYTYTVSGN